MLFIKKAKFSLNKSEETVSLEIQPLYEEI